MKKTSILMVMFFATVLQLQAQSQTPKLLGLPGDNFNLYAALKVFQESRTLEDFERAINNPNEKINNLDLDGDDQIDFIRVAERVRDNVHSITLQVGLGNQETQDIAVFVVSKDNNQKAYIQVIGDEDLYGKDYIIEPNYQNEEGLRRYADSRPNPAFQSEYENDYNPSSRNTIAYVQVANWPIVQYIYVPTYRPWVSSWGWNRYPQWWRPWRPYSRNWYAGFHSNNFNFYFGYYHRTNIYRNPSWYNWHYGNNGWRTRSVVYVNRYKKGHYRNTYVQPLPGNIRPWNNSRANRESERIGNGRERSNVNANKNENRGRPSRHYN